jgi:DNA polymerase
MFVGEGPGEKEELPDEADLSVDGIPFIGDTGQELQKLLIELGWTKNLYITNVVKHRAPGNRVPTVPERERCWSYLLTEIQIVSPVLIVALGRTAAQVLFGITDRDPIRNLKHTGPEGIRAGATYHPAAILYDRDGSQGRRAAILTDLRALQLLAH